MSASTWSAPGPSPHAVHPKLVTCPVTCPTDSSGLRATGAACPHDVRDVQAHAVHTHSVAGSEILQYISSLAIDFCRVLLFAEPAAITTLSPTITQIADQSEQIGNDGINEGTALLNSHGANIPTPAPTAAATTANDVAATETVAATPPAAGAQVIG